MLIRVPLFISLWISCIHGLEKIGLKQIDTGARVFYEIDTGREVIFHGVNAIVKGFPWVPSVSEFDIDTSLVEKDHALLSDLGVNVYRLGAMWPGVEPTRGVYNVTYVNELSNIIDKASEFGIYTLLDMHQDVLSEKYCGEGVPAWAAISTIQSADAQFPAPEDNPYTDIASDGFPTRQDCSKHGWASYYQTRTAAEAFGSLYSNYSGLLTSWANMWSLLAKSLGSSNVLGYELINEPYAGDVFADPLLLLPGYADKHTLQPAYDALVSAIRTVDQDRLVFFAGVTWDDVIPAGFTAAPGGTDEAARSVFAFHYYEPPQFEPSVYFHQRVKDSQTLLTGAMLTEFERPQGTDSADEDGDPFGPTCDHADAHLLSWACWEYKTFCKETNETLSSTSQAAAFGSCKTGYGEHLFWDDNGDQNLVASRKLARTYAQKTSGRSLKMNFNATSGAFVFTWLLNSTIVQPTEIFAHQALQYSTGMDVTVLPAGHFRWKMLSTNIIGISPTLKAVDGEKATVIIRKA